MVLEFLYPTETDILQLLNGLSPEDERELLAQGVEPEWAIRNSILNADECVAVRIDGLCEAITGISGAKALSGHAFPWLLATPEIQKYPRKVLKYSHMLLERWKLQYPYMANYVDARHHRAIQWLTHLGATLEYIPAHGLYRRPFYKFSFGSET